MDKELFVKLNSIDCSAYTEEKQGLTYLSWSSALRILKSHIDDFTFEVVENDEGFPYFDTPLGIFVKSKITVNGVEHFMSLPVLDAKNTPMFSQPGKFKWWNKEVEKPVATSFDINTAIMRCHVKNISSNTGLGIYIYEGADKPISTDIIDAKVMTKQELWSSFVNTLKSKNIGYADFLDFNNIQMTQKDILQKFVNEFVNNNSVKEQLIKTYKDYISKEKGE